MQRSLIHEVANEEEYRPIVVHSTKYYRNKCYIFFKNLYHTSFPDNIACGTKFSPTSKVCASATLVLILHEINSHKFWIPSFQWHNVHTKFHQNMSSGSLVESCGRTDIQADMATPFCVHVMHIVQTMHSNVANVSWQVVEGENSSCYFACQQVHTRATCWSIIVVVIIIIIIACSTCVYFLSPCHIHQQVSIAKYFAFVEYRPTDCNNLGFYSHYNVLSLNLNTSMPRSF